MKPLHLLLLAAAGGLAYWWWKQKQAPTLGVEIGKGTVVPLS